MPHLWIHVGLPAFLWVVLYLAEARGVRADVQRAKNNFIRSRIRHLEAIEQDQLRIVGKVVSPDGSSVNLGTSTEKPEKIRHNPELDGESFVVETQDGRRFRIRPGKIQIQRLPGAERKLVRTVTTDDGIEQTYSFEVPDGFELMVVGCRAGGEGSAFRGGPIDLAPRKDGYRVGEGLGDPRHVPKPPNVDTAKNVSLVGFLFALAAVGVGFVPYVGAFLWFPAMIIMAMTVFAFTFGNAAVEPLPESELQKLEALKVRVDVDEEVEVEEEAETAEVEAEA